MHIRRIFGELADVLGWMHSIGLVHRDIKLESESTVPTAMTFRLTLVPDILLTEPLFGMQIPAARDLPVPLIKLTDFGLSRFIDTSSPFLETRCGSEEYAAPELIMGRRYDGRQTDAWALGIVLYALVCGVLPFTETRSTVTDYMSPLRNGYSPAKSGSSKSRRSYLVRIAKGEYKWPDNSHGSCPLLSDDVKALAAGLLCREPKRRLEVKDVWRYSWMDGPGKPEKLSTPGGGMTGVSVAAFEHGDEEMVRAEVPDVA